MRALTYLAATVVAAWSIADTIRGAHVAAAAHLALATGLFALGDALKEDR
jgi:hypothetical protein